MNKTNLSTSQFDVFIQMVMYMEQYTAERQNKVGCLSIRIISFKMLFLFCISSSAILELQINQHTRFHIELSLDWCVEWEIVHM